MLRSYPVRPRQGRRRHGQKGRSEDRQSEDEEPLVLLGALMESIFTGGGPASRLDSGPTCHIGVLSSALSFVTGTHNGEPAPPSAGKAAT